MEKKSDSKLIALYQSVAVKLPGKTYLFVAVNGHCPFKAENKFFKLCDRYIIFLIKSQIQLKYSLYILHKSPFKYKLPHNGYLYKF